MGPRAGLDAGARSKILCPCRRSNPDRPARSQTISGEDKISVLNRTAFKSLHWKSYNCKLESTEHAGSLCLPAAYKVYRFVLHKTAKNFSFASNLMKTRIITRIPWMLLAWFGNAEGPGGREGGAYCGYWKLRAQCTKTETEGRINHLINGCTDKWTEAVLVQTMKWQDTGWITMVQFSTRRRFLAFYLHITGINKNKLIISTCPYVCPINNFLTN
jgi:hypothetical protein